MTHAHRFLLKWARILHVYLTLFGFVLLLFFAVTGFLLNHEDWFLPRQSTHGKLPMSLLGTPEDRTAIADKLRDDFEVAGDVESFDLLPETNSYRVVFKAQNREDKSLHEFATVTIQRADGETQVTYDPDKSRERCFVVEGQMPIEWLHVEHPKEADIIEKLRKDFAVRGERNGFGYEKESEQFRGQFKAPSYLATVVIKKDGQTKVTHRARGFVGLMLDLHRGKDSGLPWSFVIDGVSLLFVIVAITGFILWSSLRGRAQHGLAVLILGTVIGLAVYFVWVPQ